MSGTPEAAIAEPAPATAERAPVRRLLVLAAVAAGLAVLVAVTVLPGLAPPLPERSGELLVEFDPAAVRRVEIQPREGEPYAFERRGDAWLLEGRSEAQEVPADRLDGFLDTLAGMTRLVVISEPDIDPAEFGLDPPRARILLRDGKEVPIAIGDRNPPLTALYVQVLPGTNIVLVGAVLFWEFDKLANLARRQPVEP